MYIVAILILPLVALPQYRRMFSASAEGDLTRLCSLLAQPNEYAGKTVEVKGILRSSEEFQILEDDLCPPQRNPTSGKSDLVEITFNKGQYDIESATHKRLIKLLKNKRQAQVTVVATFVDPGNYFGAQGCCRYQLSVQRLISAERVPEKAGSKR